MASSKIFTQLLQGEFRTQTEVRRKTQAWLLEEYNISKIKDLNFLDALTSVHDHDDQPLHFGTVSIGSSFQTMQIELVNLPDGWHLGVMVGNGEPTLLHPRSERTTSEKAIAALLAVRQILKNGSMRVAPVSQTLPGGGVITGSSNIPPSEPASKVPSDILQQLEDMDKVEDNAGEPDISEYQNNMNMLPEEDSSVTIDWKEMFPEGQIVDMGTGSGKLDPLATEPSAQPSRAESENMKDADIPAEETEKKQKKRFWRKGK